jgi:hypothetical protein
VARGTAGVKQRHAESGRGEIPRSRPANRGLDEVLGSGEMFNFWGKTWRHRYSSARGWDHPWSDAPGWARLPVDALGT